MHKVVFTGPGGHNVTEYRAVEATAECPLPATLGVNPAAVDGRAKGTNVVVDVAAAGVNYADCCIRWGFYGSWNEFCGFPGTPGFEFSGTVAHAPVGSGFKMGQKVFGVSMFGGYSSRVEVPPDQLFARPAELDEKAAAGFPCVAITAWYAAVYLAAVREGTAVVVHSAAGGVGSMLVQICVAKGCRVLAVVGASHKVDACTAMGAHAVIDKSKGGDLWAEAKAFSPRGFHAIFDANGTETLRGGYDALAPMGRLVTYGSHSMLPRTGLGRINPIAWLKIAWGVLRSPRFSPMDMSATNKAVLGFNLSFLFDEQWLLEVAMKELLGWVKAGELRVVKTTEFALADASGAHRALESAQTTGKLVLVP